LPTGSPEHSLDDSENAMIVSDTESIDLKTFTGPMRTYVVRPVAEGRYPGLVLFSEIFQVTGPIRRTAAMLASHGFVVAIPEIYHELEPAGTVLAYDEAGAERGNRYKVTKELASYDADARAALDYLTSSPHCTGKLGVIGICIGGHLAFRAAMNSDVLAAACFYATDIHKRGLGKGTRDDSLDRITEIRGELLMIWGRQDPHIPREGRALIYNALSDAGAHFQWHEFNAAHAFIRDEGPRYDPAAARVCYDMALELFKRRLGDGDRRAAAAPTETKH
jgi:carboxymethylenebutenolidase